MWKERGRGEGNSLSRGGREGAEVGDSTLEAEEVTRSFLSSVELGVRKSI